MEVDVIVVGSGAGALLTAVRAADAGLSVQVVEKTALVGGTSAISGGGIWIPCNHDQSRHGIRDSVDEACPTPDSVMLKVGRRLARATPTSALAERRLASAASSLRSRVT